MRQCLAWAVVYCLTPGVMMVAKAQVLQPVTFERETIRIMVGTETIRVDGTYVFANPSPAARVQALRYPFPIDSLHPFPHEITVHQGEGSVAFRRVEDGIVFAIDIPPCSEATARVTYKQSCRNNFGCYILTSTAAWGRPLKAADFEITVPDSLRLVSVAYDIDQVDEVDGARIHRFARSNFLPQEDLCMRWETRTIRGWR